MASTCISSCTTDVVAIPTPIPRANYANLYKRPESDAEFILRSISNNNNNKPTANNSNPFSFSTKVVDSLSCRQMYLRSYTFSRKESFPDKTKKCVDRVRVRVRVKLLAHRHSSSSDVGIKVKKTRLLGILGKGILGKGFAVGRRIRTRLQLQLFVRIRKAISTRDHLLSSSALLLRRLLIACTCTSKIDT